MIARRRDGSQLEIYDGEGRAIEYLYNSGPGRILLRILISPVISKTAGFFLDSSLSRFMIKGFVRKNSLDLSDYPARKYRSFNDFFTRSIIPGRRLPDSTPGRLISPCDGKLTVFPLEDSSEFTIKGSPYTLGTLLRSSELSEKYRGGTGLLFRLSVDDYHRYIYPVSGSKSENVRIPGVYHTVNPRAAAARSIYRENTREYTLIESDESGTVLMMEIGAMLVGRIKNHHGRTEVLRGQEKGMFEFGGSSIMLLIEKGRILIDSDILANSVNGEETVIKCGESIGSFLI